MKCNNICEKLWEIVCQSQRLCDSTMGDSGWLSTVAQPHRHWQTRSRLTALCTPLVLISYYKCKTRTLSLIVSKPHFDCSDHSECYSIIFLTKTNSFFNSYFTVYQILISPLNFTSPQIEIYCRRERKECSRIHLGHTYTAIIIINYSYKAWVASIYRCF